MSKAVTYNRGVHRPCHGQKAHANMSTVLLQEDKTPILLLKTKSSPNDGYEEYFEATSQFIPSFIPVLEHKYNTETLQAIRRLFESGDFTGPQRKYGGLIFTSQRAVEGFASVVQEIQSTVCTLLQGTLHQESNTVFIQPPC